MMNISPNALDVQDIKFPPSIVEPDNAMSVQQIVTRHLQGQPVTLPLLEDSGDENLDHFPLDEDRFDDLTACIDGMDLTEIADMRARLNARAAELREQLKSNQNEQSSESVESSTHNQPSATSDSVGPTADA